MESQPQNPEFRNIILKTSIHGKKTLTWSQTLVVQVSYLFLYKSCFQ